VLRREPVKVIINAGSGDIKYSIDSIDVDILISPIRKAPKGLLSNIENLPLAPESIDAVVCVGSVINYNYAHSVIREFGRILRPDGILILEFENSKSLEFLGSEIFGTDVHSVHRRYKGHKHLLSLYSEAYILELLDKNKFRVERRLGFHLISPLLLRLTSNLTLSALAAKLDSLARLSFSLDRLASNVLYACRRYSADSRLVSE
jgi:SAM-dependent methyltransferase